MFVELENYRSPFNFVENKLAHADKVYVVM